MMMSDTQRTEFFAHCEAALEVLRTAGVQLFPPDEPDLPHHTGVPILPALTALQINRKGRARFRHWLAQGVYAQQSQFFCDERGQAWLVLPVTEVLYLSHWSKHAVGKAFAVWSAEVDVALLAHGWYDPATGQRVPVGGEVDTIEVQSEARERYRAMWGNSWEETWGRFQDTEG